MYICIKMIFLTSDFSDLSYFFIYSFNNYLILDVFDYRLGNFYKKDIYIKENFPFLYNIDSIALVFTYFIGLVFQVSYIIMREFFIESKFFFFNRKKLIFYFVHLIIRFFLNLVYIVIYNFFIIYIVVYKGFVAFSIMTFFCIIFVTFFSLFNSAIGVFFILFVLNVYGIMLIFYFNLHKTLYYIKFYWKDFERKYDTYHRINSKFMYNIYG